MRFRPGDKVKRIRHIYDHFHKDQIYTVHSYNPILDSLVLKDGPVIHTLTSLGEEWDGCNFKVIQRNEPSTEAEYYKWLADRIVT